MRITPIKTKRLKRHALKGRRTIKAKELKELMRANDGLEDIETVNNLTPAIKLLYFIHEWLLDQAEKEE